MNEGQTTTVLVVHIPKAAGTTLRVILERQYADPKSRVFTIQDNIPAERERLAALPAQDKRKLGAVFGHMCWGWHTALAAGQRHEYLTILRDPAERVLSYYAYARLGNHYLRKAVEGMDLREFLTSGVTRTCDNGMVRQLCGQDRFLREPYLDMDLAFDGVKEEHVQRAMRNLDRCAVVGIAEDFDRVLDQCRRKLGWRIPTYTNQNVTSWPRPTRMELDRHTVRMLNYHNRYDEQLYQYAKEIAG